MLNPRCYYFGLQVDPIEALSEAIPGSPGSLLAMMFLQPNIPFLISPMHCNVPIGELGVLVEEKVVDGLEDHSGVREAV